MITSEYRVRRATVDDLPGLLMLWQSMQFPAAELEPRLTEFQIVETADGTLLGALAVEVTGRYGRLHSEAFNDFALADTLRAAFWERLQNIATNLGLTRFWTTETAPYWRHEAFNPAGKELVAKLPPTWSLLPGEWLTVELRDEEVMRAALETAFTQLKHEHLEESQSVLRQARSLKYIAVTLSVIVAIAGVAFCIYLLRHAPNLFHR